MSRRKIKGVSPIIGTILLVAITVVLAAVIGTFVFGLGTQVEAAPKAQFMLKDAKDRINDDRLRIYQHGQRVRGIDAICTITHVGGDPIRCEDIQFIVKDITHGYTWTLVYDGGNVSTRVGADGGALGEPTQTIDHIAHVFYDPSTNKSPIILCFGTAGVNHSNYQLGGPEYNVRNDGILQTGDTVILMEGNVPIFGITGRADNRDVDNDGGVDNVDYLDDDYHNYLTEWLAEGVFYHNYGNYYTGADTYWPFQNVWNSTDTPFELEITIVHVPTKSIIYQGSVMVQ